MILSKSWLEYFLKTCAIISLVTINFHLSSCHQNEAQAVDRKNTVLSIEPQSSIVFIGNTFADRMQLFGHFETYLHCRFPKHQLKIRNMGWPADEVDLQPRPVGFKPMEFYLKEENAAIIFAAYGLNESFEGPDSLKAFETDLFSWISRLKEIHKSKGDAPQIVLLSPICFEDQGDGPNFDIQNRRLVMYVDAMSEVASKANVLFVDLFTPTMQYNLDKEGGNLTFNGIHLNRLGDWRVSHMLSKALFGEDEIDPSKTMSSLDSIQPAFHALRRKIYDKNYSYRNYWRGPNMEYIYGSRNDAPGANRMPEERAQLASIISQQDQVIWQATKPNASDIWNYMPAGELMWTKAPIFDGIQIPAIPEAKLKEELRGDEKAGQITNVEKAISMLKLPDGYEVNLFASEKDFPLANPMAMHFDHRGRLWVANTPTWPHPEPGKRPEDFIVILEDKNKDGAADHHTLFLENLDLIHGFALYRGGAIVSQTPYLIFAKDTDGDDQADHFEHVLQGFGAEDAEHSINNLTWAPDGGLYFLNGIFFHSQIETANGPIRMIDSGVFRYTPRNGKLTTHLSSFFWNPWGLVFDKFGQGIMLDASSGDLYHISPFTANYKYPKEKVTMDSYEAEIRKPNAKIMHEILSIAPDGIGSAAGIHLIENSHFPPEAQGRLLSNQIEGWRGTHWFEMRSEGSQSTLSVLSPELLFSEDPYFRPVAIEFGPDGALYILDFYSPIFENVEFPKRSRGRDHSHGRIWRVTYPSRPLVSVPDFANASTSDLLELLKSSEGPHRYFARRALQESHSKEIIPNLDRWSKSQQGRIALEALWIYEGLGVENPKLLQRLLESEDPFIRAAATRTLRNWQSNMPEAEALLVKLINDAHIQVRLEAVVACSFSNLPNAKTIAMQVSHHPMDEGLQLAWHETIKFLDEKTDTKATNIKLVETEQLLSLALNGEISQEILSRSDLLISLDDRYDAAKYLAGLDLASIAKILIEQLSQGETPKSINTLYSQRSNQLRTLLFARPVTELRQVLQGAAKSSEDDEIHSNFASRCIIAAMVNGSYSKMWKQIAPNNEMAHEFIRQLRFLPKNGLDNEIYDILQGILQSENIELKNMALQSIQNSSLRSKPLLKTIQKIFENPQQDSPARINALKILSNSSFAKSENYPEIIRIEIGTVPGKMKYDLEQFTVAASAPVELVFSNQDLMPHNLLICQPGQLKAVGEAADRMSNQSDALSKSYRPDMEAVLFDIPLISSQETYTLPFFAPEKPGAYPFVCTFPGHWRTMNGIVNIVDQKRPDS